MLLVELPDLEDVQLPDGIDALEWDRRATIEAVDGQVLFDCDQAEVHLLVATGRVRGQPVQAFFPVPRSIAEEESANSVVALIAPIIVDTFGRLELI